MRNFFIRWRRRWWQRQGLIALGSPVSIHWCPRKDRRGNLITEAEAEGEEMGDWARHGNERGSMAMGEERSQWAEMSVD